MNANLNPKGTRDFNATDLKRRDQVIEVIKTTYRSYGFSPLETPAIENLEVLMGKYGEEGNQLLFKIKKRGAKENSGECDLGLRYDLTVPFTRFVSTNQNSLPKFYKRYQIQPVWRADRPSKGRYREFYQCDIDSIGSKSPTVEIDLLSASLEVFRSLKIDDIRLKINDRRILMGILDKLGLNMSQQLMSISSIDKLSKIGITGVVEELKNKDIPQDALNKLSVLFTECIKHQKVISFDRLLSSVCDFIGLENSEVAFSYQNLKTIYSGLVCSGFESEQIIFDPFLARGMDYYSGTIFEVDTEESSGSLAGGGRYDNFIKRDKNSYTPACGISLGLDRIILLMTEREMFSSENYQNGILLSYFDENTIEETYRVASIFRKNGIAVTIYPQKDSLSKQFEYANNQRFLFTGVIGPDELKDQLISIKDMKSGKKSTVTYQMAYILMDTIMQYQALHTSS